LSLALSGATDSATVALMRGTTRIARVTRAVAGARAAVGLLLPRRTRPGHYVLQVTVRNAAGRTFTARRRLRIR